MTQRKRAEQTARFLAHASAALAVLVDFDSTLQKVASLAVPHFADWMTVDVLEDNGNLRRVAVAHVDPAKVHLAHDLHRRFPADPSAPNGLWNILRTGQAEIAQVITELSYRHKRSPKTGESTSCRYPLPNRGWLAIVMRLPTPRQRSTTWI